MKTTSILIASASLFAALGLAMPAPASSETIQVGVKTGDDGVAVVRAPWIVESPHTRGLSPSSIHHLLLPLSYLRTPSAVDLTVTINQVFSTANNLLASKGVTATTSDSTATCQAFSDNAGTIPLGSPFTADTPASFGATSSDGTESKSEDAVPIGAFFCSNSPDGLLQTRGSDVPSTASARVLLEIGSGTFIERDVPVDSSSFLISTTALDISVVDATDVDVNRVSCQAFADVAAKQPVGEPATSAGDGALTTDFNNPVPINAIVCSA